MHGPLPISIFDPSLNHKKLTIDLEDTLVQTPLLINSLYMRPRSKESRKLVLLSKQLYERDQCELSNIQEFEKKYSTEVALHWYTRDSFLTRLLNKTLRTQNIDDLLLFHFFIIDIQSQLKSLHNRPREAYRSQFMPKNQLERLQKANGKFISINSFLSAYPKKNQALAFLRRDDPLEKVLFEIHADPTFVKIRPYAYIKEHSVDGQEEILFMVGSIFKIEQFKRENDNVWVFQLKLYPDHGQSLKLIPDDSNERLSFGHVLETIGKLDEAEIFYQSMRSKIPKDDPNIARCYEALAGVADERGEYGDSLAFYQEALTHNLQSKQPALVIASNYNDIGEAFRKKHQVKEALKSHEEALRILTKANAKQNPAKQAVCHNSMGIAYQELKDYRKALECYMKAFEIRKEHCSFDEISMGMSFNNIGNAHYYLGHPEDAEYYYGEALKYYKKKLPQSHPKIASTYNNLGVLYEKQEKLHEAFCCYRDALIIYDGIYSNRHPYVDQIRENIDEMQMRIKR